MEANVRVIHRRKPLSPFAWQAKKHLRVINANFNGRMLKTALAIYLGITWVASDFVEKEVRNWTQTIATYVGMRRQNVNGYLKKFENLGLIKRTRVKNKGKFDGWLLEILD